MGYELGSSHQRTKIEGDQTEYEKDKDGYVVKYTDIQEVGTDRGECTQDAFWGTKEELTTGRGVGDGQHRDVRPKKQKANKQKNQRERERKRQRRQLKPNPKLYTEQYERNKDVDSSLVARLSTSVTAAAGSKANLF